MCLKRVYCSKKLDQELGSILQSIRGASPNIGSEAGRLDDNPLIRTLCMI